MPRLEYGPAFRLRQGPDSRFFALSIAHLYRPFVSAETEGERPIRNWVALAADDPGKRVVFLRDGATDALWQQRDGSIGKMIRNALRTGVMKVIEETPGDEPAPTPSMRSWVEVLVVTSELEHVVRVDPDLLDRIGDHLERNGWVGGNRDAAAVVWAVEAQLTLDASPAPVNLAEGSGRLPLYVPPVVENALPLVEVRQGFREVLEKLRMPRRRRG